MNSKLSLFSLALWISLLVSHQVRRVDGVAGGPAEYALMNAIQSRHPDFIPRSIVDVGANRGDWTLGVKNIFPNASFFMLEASPDKDVILKEVVAKNFPDHGQSKAGYRIAVMSAIANETIAFFQGGDTGNSMFRENTHHYANQEPVMRQTSTLDMEIEASFIDVATIDILKIDVQGAEVMVLKGGSKVLEAATFVQLESGLIEYNAGGCCFFELDDLLRSHGFHLYDFGEMWRSLDAFKSPGVGQFDMLYVKPSSRKLPQSLQASKFCGANKEKIATAEDDHLKYIGASLDTNKVKDGFISEQPNRSSFVPFVLGFCCAVVLQILLQFAASSRDEKTLHRSKDVPHSNQRNTSMLAATCILGLFAMQAYQTAIIFKSSN
jgi:FkbM family methyltransferase